MEDLLAFDDGSDGAEASDRPGPTRRPRGLYDWVPSEGGPLTLPAGTATRRSSVATSEESRFAVEHELPARSNGHDSVFLREGELMSKLHDLLHSPIGDGVARGDRGAAHHASEGPWVDLTGGFGARARFIG